MLSSMNVTVIPFLLEALMSVENVTEWNFGPEYTFQMNKATTVYINEKHKINLTEKITAMVVCRPKIVSQNIRNESEILFCHVKNITVRTNITRQIYEDWNKIAESTDTDIEKSINFREKLNKMPDQLFQIEFGRQGVQNFEVEARKKEPCDYDIIRDIVDQFNIGIDLSTATADSMRTVQSYVISTLTQYKENTTKASDCKTSGVIIYPLNKLNQYDKSEEFWVQKNKTKFGLQLRLLPISYSDHINKPLSINRIRNSCIYHSQHFMLFNQRWRIDNMEQYFNKMEIHDKEPKFTSYTHLEGHVSFPENLDTYYHFTEDVHLQLLRIQPAHTKRLYWDYYTYD